MGISQSHPAKSCAAASNGQFWGKPWLDASLLLHRSEALAGKALNNGGCVLQNGSFHGGSEAFLVGGLEHLDYFPYIGKNHPKWRTPSFFRGVGIPPTSFYGLITIWKWNPPRHVLRPCWRRLERNCRLWPSTRAWYLGIPGEYWVVNDPGIRYMSIYPPGKRFYITTERSTIF